MKIFTLPIQSNNHTITTHFISDNYELVKVKEYMPEIGATFENTKMFSDIWMVHYTGPIPVEDVDEDGECDGIYVENGEYDFF